jgi:hypothetical protein
MAIMVGVLHCVNGTAAVLHLFAEHLGDENQKTDPFKSILYSAKIGERTPTLAKWVNLGCQTDVFLAASKPGSAR